jgi:putative tricarboxylic transport membrane protein
MVERAVALAVLVACGVYLASGWALPLGTIARPGPGLYPLAVGVLGGFVAMAWVVTAFRRAPAGAGPRAEALKLEAGPGGMWRPGTSGRRVIATAGLLVAFCFLLPWVGYPLAAFLFTGLLLRGLGASWIAALAIALACAVVSYYLFGVVLGVPLPRGPLLD